MIYRSEDRRIRMVLTGDSLITRPMSLYDEPDFLSLVDLLRSADVAVTNAEMLFHDYESPPTAVPGGTYMQAHPRIIDELSWMGFSLLASANNHAYDFGENGLLTHFHHLKASGFAFAGIGRNMGEAREPAYVDTPAGRVAIVSATSSGPAGLYAQHQWRDGIGRPGANMIRHTSRYTVDRTTFDVLRELRDGLGLRGRTGFRDHSFGASALADSDDEFYMGDLHDHWQYVVPNGYQFAVGDELGRVLVPDKHDLEENLQRIHDARRMADWVIVSMHNHEQGVTIDLPSDVAVRFAHAAIDAGADVFHGHGPHRDRGIEIYRGKPILYSIGHFIVQNETVARMPMDNMVRQGLDRWEATPADFFDSRSGREWMGEWASHGTNPAAWRDIVAVVEFEDGALSKVELVPIDLGYRRPRSQRGRPVLARGDEARDVLELFQRLSSPFGTVIESDGTRGLVRLPEPTAPQEDG
jgi:poly-gamma-glutamate capsule biosynthesis protein CapA/YwtB (metallophosphatase superfamily)